MSMTASLSSNIRATTLTITILHRFSDLEENVSSMMNAGRSGFTGLA